LFPWARFRRAKAAIKLHNAAGFAWLHPTFISIHRATSRCPRLDELILEAGAFYVDGRGDRDFQRLYGLSWPPPFLSPFQNHLQFNRLESRPVDSSTGVRQ